MQQTETLSIVVPCHNEEGTVAELLRRVSNVQLPEGWTREIIVVDDASTDRTPDILAGVGDSIRIITRTTNGGKGSAVADGLQAATGTYCIIQDADLEYDPNDITRLIEALTPGTAVYGSRYLEPRSRRGAFGLYAGVWVITSLINLLHGTKLTDACACYRLFPREAIPLFPNGGFEADILFSPALARAGYKIHEVQVSYDPRTKAAGKKIKYMDGIRALGAILADSRRHGRAKPSLVS